MALLRCLDATVVGLPGFRPLERYPRFLGRRLGQDTLARGRSVQVQDFWVIDCGVRRAFRMRNRSWRGHGVPGMDTVHIGQFERSGSNDLAASEKGLHPWI